MDIVATNYCRTLENIDAVRRFWSALANLKYQQAEPKIIKYHYFLYIFVC